MRTLTAVFIVVTFIPATLGCGSDSSKPDPRSVDPTRAAIRAAVRSNESVAWKLHSVLREQPGNLFYSPLSIEAVLGMLYAGSDGDTAKQIGEVLDVAGDPQELHQGLGELLADLAGPRENRGYTLSLANRLWAADGLDSSQDFIDTTRDSYDAPMELADFSEPERVREDINTWVDKLTQGKISELLRQGQITTNTVMTVVNAIYFEGEWSKAFDPKNTRTGMFRRADETSVQAEMMQTPITRVRFAHDAQGTLIELPYRGSDIAFLAYLGDVVPNDVSTFEANLDAGLLNELVGRLAEDECVVVMPRFSLRSRLDLIPTFNTLGVTDLFDQSRANLTKIDPTPGLFVDPFVHEAAVQVDEKGTVAAAATAAGVTRKSAAHTIVLDRPFLFFIRDNLTRAILFTGRVADPTAE